MTDIIPVAAAALTPSSSASISAFCIALDNARDVFDIPDRSAVSPNT